MNRRIESWEEAIDALFEERRKGIEVTSWTMPKSQRAPYETMLTQRYPDMEIPRTDGQAQLLGYPITYDETN